MIRSGLIRVTVMVVLTFLLAACASSTTELVFNMRSEGCSYDGPTELEPGQYDLLLYLDGLGEAELEMRSVASDGSTTTVEILERRWLEQDVTSASSASV